MTEPLISFDSKTQLSSWNRSNGTNDPAVFAYADGSRWRYSSSGTTNGGSIISASDGGVWVRELVNEVITPEMFGAVGDSATDDRLAIGLMCAAYQSGQTMLLANTYRIARGDIPGHQVGALEVTGRTTVDIDFAGTGMLLMDNLNDQGLGDQFSGIFIMGNGDPRSFCSIRNRPVVRWVTRPADRSQGDGIMVRGYPQDGGSTYLGGLVIDHPEVYNSPQAHIICLGVSDPHIIAPYVEGGRADGVHMNACRRPRVTGGVRGLNIGDDLMPFVTYTGPVGPLDGKTGLRNPYSLPDLGDWSNGYGYVDSVVLDGSSADAVRLSGAFGVTIETVTAKNSSFGVQADATVRNGSNYEWTGAASRQCRVGRILTDNVSVALLCHTQGDVASQTDPTLFTQFDLEIGQVVTRNSRNDQSVVRVSGVTGVRITSVDTDGNLELNAGVDNCSVGTAVVKGSILIDFAGTLELGIVRCKQLITNNSTLLTGRDWLSTNADADAFYLNNVTVQGPRLRIVNPNRSGNPDARGLLLGNTQHVRISGVDCVTDDKPLRLLELGGGYDATHITTDVQLGLVTFIGQNAPNVVQQGGPWAPTNVRYDLHYGTDGFNWTVNTVNTYPASS